MLSLEAVRWNLISLVFLSLYLYLKPSTLDSENIDEETMCRCKVWLTRFFTSFCASNSLGSTQSSGAADIMITRGNTCTLEHFGATHNVAKLLNGIGWQKHGKSRHVEPAHNTRVNPKPRSGYMHVAETSVSKVPYPAVPCQALQMF